MLSAVNGTVLWSGAIDSTVAVALEWGVIDSTVEVAKLAASVLLLDSSRWFIVMMSQKTVQIVAVARSDKLGPELNLPNQSQPCSDCCDHTGTMPCLKKRSFVANSLIGGTISLIKRNYRIFTVYNGEKLRNLLNSSNSKTKVIKVPDVSSNATFLPQSPVIAIHQLQRSRDRPLGIVCWPAQATVMRRLKPRVFSEMPPMELSVTVLRKAIGLWRIFPTAPLEGTAQRHFSSLNLLKGSIDSKVSRPVDPHVF